MRNQDTKKSCTFEMKLCVLARGQQADLRRKGLTREMQYGVTMNFAASYEITALTCIKRRQNSDSVQLKTALVFFCLNLSSASLWKAEMCIFVFLVSLLSITV